MNDIIELPSKHSSFCPITGQNYIQDVVQAELSPLQVQYDGELYYVPTTVREAKRLLRHDNIDSEDARSVRSIVSEYAQKGVFAIPTWAEELELRLSTFIMDTKLGGSLFHHFIIPEVISLVSNVFGFPDNRYLTALHQEVVIGSGRIESVVSRALESKSPFIDDLLSLGIQDPSIGLKMAYGVTVEPMANWAALALYIKSRSNHEHGNLPVSVFRRLCSEYSIVYPGLFREVDDRHFLIPATWRDTYEHFSFGYGPRSCPGRKLVFEFLKNLLEVCDFERMPQLGFVRRLEAPFGISDILVKGLTHAN